jgi:hypothetical protein
MNILVAIFALFMVGIGLYGLAAPKRLAGFVALWQSREGLWLATAFRLVFALALWLAAPASKAPLALQIVAVLALIGGLSLPLIGLDRYVRVIGWWLGLPERLQRAWLAPAAGLGLFLLWAVA